MIASSLTLSNTQLDFKVNRRRHNRLRKDKDILQTNYHHKVREDFPAKQQQRKQQTLKINQN